MTTRSISLWGFSTRFAVYEPGPLEESWIFDKQLQRPALEEWHVPVAVEACEVRGKPAAPGDFPGSTGFMHFLSPRAQDLMGDVFSRYGTLYPVAITGQPSGWCLFQPTNVVDCLDLERSTVSRSVIRAERINSILKPSFVENQLPGGGMFLVPECVHGDIYVCEDVKELVKRHKLNGFVLQREFFGKQWVS